jgi:hypothetical protein
MKSQSTTRQIVGQSILYGIAVAVGGAIGRAFSGLVWFSWLMWLVVVAELVVGLVIGVRFRRGDPRYIDWLDQDGPDSVRLLPILGIPLAIFGLPLLLLIGALFAWPPEWPRSIQWLVGFGLLAWGLTGLGIVTLMAYRPPFWLVPPWVLAQDRYAPIELRTYRRSFLIGGVAELLLAGVATAAAIIGSVYFQGR